ncbi:MAG: cation:proton antiporter [Oscillospiraceae bacterium]|jgi:Kef-type K+ transport system membrane component KefB
MLNISSLYSKFNPNTAILLSIAVMLFSGFLATRITKKLKLPNVSGYIIAGILIGPSVLHLVPDNIIENCAFLSDVALAFIAFDAGKFFRRESLEKTGKSVILITVIESLVSGVVIALVCHFVLGLTLDLSLLLGAIATETAPTSTLMTINQYKASGDFVDMLLQIIGVDNIICLFIYSVVSAVVGSKSTLDVATVVLPVVYNLLAIGLGALCGLLLCTIITPKRTSENRLILTVGLLCGLAGLCAVMNISPLLSCMMFGAVYINRSHSDAIYYQMKHFTPPIMSVFFVVSGMNLNLGAVRTFGLIGIVYVVVRIIGKYAGAYLGCAVTHKSAALRNYLGLALIPQASVAIGLAFLGQRLLPPEIGELLLSIVLAAAVLYELIGPACAKLALSRSGAIPKDTEAVSQK